MPLKRGTRAKRNDGQIMLTTYDDRALDILRAFGEQDSVSSLGVVGGFVRPVGQANRGVGGDFGAERGGQVINSSLGHDPSLSQNSNKKKGP